MADCPGDDTELTAQRGVVRRAGTVVLTCWHGETDTLPWVEPCGDDPGTVDLLLPVGAYSPAGETPRIEVRARFDGSEHVHSSDHGGGVQPLVPGAFLGAVDHGRRLRGEPGALERRWHRVDLARAVAAGGGERFFFVLTLRAPRDAEVTYTVSATTPLVGLAASATFTLRASAPEFTRDDVRAVHCEPDHENDDHRDLGSWVLLHRRLDGMDHVRLDVVSTVLAGGRGRARPPLRIQVGGHVFDLGAGRADAPADEAVALPLLDRESDSVTVSVPAGGDGPPEVRVRTPAGETSADLTSPAVPPVWLMLVNYCIQGLNDLFEVPHERYDPPRTYMQVTMRDEAGTWSSRPGSNEDGDPDGYSLTLDAHRYYGVPSMWAFNAAVLTMIAHDCPDDYRRLRDDVRSRLLVPVNAGFGAHRPPYYRTETNRQEIRRGREVIRELLPGAPEEGLAVYYPDQRLYQATQQETEVYLEHDLVTHLVLDRSTLCAGVGAEVPQRAIFPTSDADEAYPAPEFAGDRLLHDSRTGCTILPIEDVVRELLLSGDDDDLERGKTPRRLRRLFLQALARRDGEGPGAPPVLLVYGDDADKASGCGWFDGDYSGRPLHFDARYQATLCWLSRHPWVRVVTVADEDVRGAARVDLDLDLASATCPSVDPGGATVRDRYGNLLHFDTWAQRWADTPSAWLGEPLGALSERVEQSLLRWSDGVPERLQEPAGSLVDLAWMTYLGLHHEMMWNKEPLEGGHTNHRCGVLVPEDFVVAASLQLRNAQVYLHAAVWAGWAAAAGGDETTYLDRGPLIDHLVDLARGGADGLHWDGDLLPNDILCNRHVLAVLDRNGGRITHLFAYDHGRNRPVCVSGTPKTYQWTGPAPGRTDWLTCDGEVLENTVLTPNHLYVGSDLRQARAVVGLRNEERPRQPSPQPWLYPDTFNAYEVQLHQAPPRVRYTYGPPRGMQPKGPIDSRRFAQACRADRLARLNGGRGVVWHTGPPFSKTVTLHGARVDIAYEGAPPGHLVGNEFCVDVHAALTRGAFQQRCSDREGRWFSVAGPDGVSVTLTTGAGCRLTPPALVHDLATAQVRGISRDHLRLHRVLTDAVEVQSAGGGGFRYVVDITCAAPRP
jgi:hypothetical protein